MRFLHALTGIPELDPSASPQFRENTGFHVVFCRPRSEWKLLDNGSHEKGHVQFIWMVSGANARFVSESEMPPLFGIRYRSLRFGQRSGAHSREEDFLTSFHQVLGPTPRLI